MKTGMILVPIAFVNYGIHVLLIARLQLESKIYFIIFAVLLLIIKVLYYIWSIEGIILYLGDMKS